MSRKFTKKLKWSDLMNIRKGETKPYQSASSFYVGDYITHKSFGMGYIQSSFGNKIEVLFEDKIRLLVHRILI